jgi:hypothetical protein
MEETTPLFVKWKPDKPAITTNLLDETKYQLLDAPTTIYDVAGPFVKPLIVYLPAPPEFANQNWDKTIQALLQIPSVAPKVKRRSASEGKLVQSYVFLESQITDLGEHPSIIQQHGMQKTPESHWSAKKLHWDSSGHWSSSFPAT